MLEVVGPLDEAAVSLQRVPVLGCQLRELFVRSLQFRQGHALLQGLLQRCRLVRSHFLWTTFISKKQKTKSFSLVPGDDHG